MKILVLITVICLVTHEKIADSRIVNTDGIRTSWSVFDDDVGLQLRKSLKANIEQVVIELIATANNATHEDEGLDIFNAKGVDVYIVVDVSKSIDESKYNKTKEFLKALLPNLGITNRTYGTRITLHYFALTYASMFNSVFALAFSNYSEAQSAIDAVKIETISREENGSANASCMALEDVVTTIETLQFVHYCSRKLVIIIISDGKFTQRCNAKKITDYVKDEKLAEIYSIVFGTIQDAETGFQSMKDLASDIDGEKLFFKINAAEKDLKRTIDLMINPI